MSDKPGRKLHWTEARYRRYLKQPRWRLLRWLARQRDGDRCRICGSPHHLQAHHRSYENLAAPGVAGLLRELGDLTTLCDACHRKAHNR